MTLNNPPTSLDEVIQRLSEIIEQAKQTSSRIGYFAALYWKMTNRVKAGIVGGSFADGPRMERLSVCFALRYLTAWQQYPDAKADMTQSWRFAFDCTGHVRPIILQHLVLGIHTHINLDLGIAVAETVSVGELPGLKGDYDLINDILRKLLREIQEDIASVSPAIAWLDRIGARTLDEFIHFSLTVARAEAWNAAERLTLLSGEARQKEIARMDNSTLEFANGIRHPGWLFAPVMLWVRLWEQTPIPEVIERLTD